MIPHRNPIQLIVYLIHGMFWRRRVISFPDMTDPNLDVDIEVGWVLRTWVKTSLDCVQRYGRWVLGILLAGTITRYVLPYLVDVMFKFFQRQ